MNHVIEMDQFTGTVEYSFNGMSEEEPKSHLERFQSMAELMNLLQEKKLKQLQTQLQVDDLKVEGICFNTETPDHQTKVELLLMEHEFFGQVLQSA